MRSPRRWGLVLVALLALPFWVPPRYRFSATTPFSGAWVNPYQASAGSGWRKVAVHAHAQAWGGVTSGRQSRAEVTAAYLDAGYDEVVLTDYMSAEGGAYEHGLNVTKTHQLVFGAESVLWFDQPWPTLNGKQFVLKALAARSQSVAIAHPTLRGGYLLEDFNVLDGYRLMEVARHGLVRVDPWDVALNSGHRVYAIAGDDTHDVTDEAQTFRAWLRVRPGPLLARLLAGQAYVVWVDVPHADDGATVESVTISPEELLVVRFSQPMNAISLIGPAGTLSVVHDSYELQASVAGLSFVRVEAKQGAANYLLNPLTRERGRGLSEIDWVQSELWWAVPLMLWLWLWRRSGKS